jgi:hypothetical protein
MAKHIIERDTGSARDPQRSKIESYLLAGESTSSLVSWKINGRAKVRMSTCLAPEAHSLYTLLVPLYLSPTTQ